MELEELEGELEDVRLQRLGLEGTFQTAAEKVQLADQVIMEEVALQATIQDLKSKLQGLDGERHRTLTEIERHKTEMKELAGMHYTPALMQTSATAWHD